MGLPASKEGTKENGVKHFPSGAQWEDSMQWEQIKKIRNPI